MLRVTYAVRWLWIGCCFWAVGANAQSKNRTDMSRFSLFVEGGSSAYISATSLNAEYTFFISNRERVRLNARLGAGAGTYTFGPGGVGGLMGFTMLTGKKSHHFEWNVGIYYLNETWNGEGNSVIFTPYHFVLPNFNIGYRFQPVRGGFLFKINAGIPGIGVGLGYAF